MKVKEKTTEFDSVPGFNPGAMNFLKIHENICVSVHVHIFLGKEPVVFIIISELTSQTIENHWTRRAIVKLEMKEEIYWVPVMCQAPF